MSVSDVIRRRGMNYNVQRPTAATVTDGYAIPGTATQLRVFAHVQPLTQNELRNLPPGQNGSDFRNIWSLQKIMTRDRIYVEGEWFTLQAEEAWKEGTFWHGRLERVKETA